MEKHVEQEKVDWSAKITKYQIRNILFLLYIYGLIFVIHLTGLQPIQLVLNPFNWSPNSSTGLFSAKMANFDKTNWCYLFFVHPPNPVKWSQAHSTGPQSIQLVPKFQYWLIQCQNSQFWQNKVILSFLAKSVLTKERRGQLKKLNSNVRGLCNGPCTHGECVRACVRALFEIVIDLSF